MNLQLQVRGRSFYRICIMCNPMALHAATYTCLCTHSAPRSRASAISYFPNDFQFVRVFFEHAGCYRFGQWSVRAQPSKHGYACPAVFWEINLYWKWHRIDPIFTANRVPRPRIRSAPMRGGKRFFLFKPNSMRRYFFVLVDSLHHDFLTSLVGRWEREAGVCTIKCD